MQIRLFDCHEDALDRDCSEADRNATQRTRVRPIMLPCGENSLLLRLGFASNRDPREENNVASRKEYG